MTALVLGAPGIYREPERADRAYTGIRLDIAGFVGVAPRGPVGEATRVENWSEYRRRFGGYEGPGRLPYAVSAFFEQGGERAYIVRVVPRAEPPNVVAVHELPGVLSPPGRPPVLLAAADEGAWGDDLRIQLAFDATRQFQVPRAEFDDFDAAGVRLEVPDGYSVPIGSLVRVRAPGATSRELRWVVALEEHDVGLRRRRYAVLDRPVVMPSPDTTPPTTVAVVEGVLTIEDLDRRFARAEVHPGLGLHPDHPHWLARVLLDDSLLVRPIGEWQQHPIEPATALLPTAIAKKQVSGRDRYGDIDGDDFFDEPWDPLSERSYRGVQALLPVEEIGLVSVPDLLWDEVEPPPPAPPAPEPEPARPVFVRCPPDLCCRRPASSPAPPRPPVDSLAVLLDARFQDGLEEAVRRQQELVGIAKVARRFTALLDVPPGLPASR